MAKRLPFLIIFFLLALVGNKNLALSTDYSFDGFWTAKLVMLCQGDFVKEFNAKLLIKSGIIKFEASRGPETYIISGFVRSDGRIEEFAIYPMQGVTSLSAIYKSPAARLKKNTGKFIAHSSHLESNGRCSAKVNFNRD